MSINLSDLTSPNNQDALAEITSAADFLDPIGKLENLSRSPNKGGHALQTTALNQPRALPLVDGDGYLYVPDVVSNTCSTPDDSSIDITGDITIDIDLTLKNWNDGTERNLVSKYRTSDGQRSYRLFVTTANRLSFVISSSGAFESGGSRSPTATVNFPDNQRAQIRVQWRSSDGRVQFFTSTDKGQTFTQLGVDLFTSGITSIYNGSADLDIAHRTNLNRLANSAIHSVKIYDSVTPSSSSLRLNCDFTATSVRHGDTKFKCATNQIVTINQDSSSSNDVATIIKKPVLRFDGVNDFMDGLLNQTITSGYMFAAFSVLGDGGLSFVRLFSTNPTGGNDGVNSMMIRRNSSGDELRVRYDSASAIIHDGMYDSARGDMLLNVKITNGEQNSFINNADEENTSLSGTVGVDDFVLAARKAGDFNMPIDLEYLALFSVDSVPDEATATKIRDYINKRNNVFSLVDNGYYFFDPQKATFTGNFTDANTLDGYITGSDNGDTDVRSNLNLVQATQNDQPSTDGYTITFNDAAEHLEFENGASQNLSGWQVVGTSLGTFAYRVDNDAVTELNLLGNLGSASFRQAGQSYGMMLLPDSATGGDIEAARKLLIDRGAADGVSGTTLERHFSGRQDIVNFNHIETSNVTEMWAAFLGCNNIVSYPLIDTSSVTSMGFAFQSNNSLESFPAIQAPLCVSFQNTWQGTTALQSFPAGAKLGTEANNVNFSNAWRSSGLTSFSTPLPTATNTSNAWLNCSSLTSFSTELPQATTVSQSWYGCTSLTSFSTELPSVYSATYAWYNCTSLTDFSADVFSNWNPSSITSGVFNQTWVNCPLTAQSVENILTSIDASGKYGTSTGASGGTALGDAGIDIDYNGDPLSAATNAAIDSLSGKGWEVFINGVLVIPNILDLQPAAAYSLRSFDASADPNVVNVRRSSDGATSDFTASQVSDGTLTDWVNTDVDLVTPTLNNGGFEDGSTGWTLSNGAIDTSEFYAGSKSVKLTVTGGAGAFVYKANLQVGSSYRVGFWAKISDASKQMRVEFGSAANKEDINFTSTDWEYKEVTKSATAVGLAFARQSTSGDYTINIDNITITQLTADGHVTTWYDQGGTNHATQTSGSAQPKIVDAGTLVTDGSGNPAIIGDGVDDTLVHPTLTNELDSSDFLVTAAYKDDLAMGIEGSIPRLYIQKGGFSYNTLGTVNYTDQTGRKVLSAQVSGNTQEVFSNGTSLGTATETQVDIGQNMFHVMQGGSAFSNGPLMEVVVFGDNQSANRTGIETNINDHFDIYS